MKVLFINTVYGRGSTGRIVRQLGQAVEKAGGQFVAAYGRGDTSDPEHSYRIGGKLHTYGHALLSRITDRAGFYSTGATRKLVAFIREYQPDVIHLHNLHGYYLNIEILFQYLKTEYPGKVVWTLHDCWAFTGHCVHYTYVKCQKWKTGCHHCSQKNTYPVSYVADNAEVNYNRKKEAFSGVPNMTIVAVSQWLKEQAKQSFLGCYPVECVYNGIDYTRFMPLESNIREKLGIGKNKMILAASDGWNERKGLSRLLAVSEQAPEDWRFVIVGLDPKQIRSLPANCIGMERTWNQEELIKLYSAADVFYNPSVEETFGLVTAEAIACGTPAVVMDSTACPEPLGGYGRVLSTSGTQEAINAIKDVLTWEKNQPERAFTEEKMMAGYLSCYRG